MEIQADATMRKWFDETFSHLRGRNEPPKQLYALLLGTLQCGRKYCNGVLALLVNDHKMPAAALLRILCELSVKLRWCLQAPDRTDAPDQDNCHQRLRSWDYKRAIDHRKMLKRMRNGGCGGREADVDRMIGELDQDIDQLKKDNLPPMPKTVLGIFEELEKLQKGWGDLYPDIYQRFSRAVHVDMGLIRQMVQRSGDQVLCLEDPPEYNKLDLLYYCVAMGCDINHMVRRYYSWDPEEMQHECDSLLAEIVEMKKANR